MGWIMESKLHKYMKGHRRMIVKGGEVDRMAMQSKNFEWS